jgi:hypothetical protein
MPPRWWLARYLRMTRTPGYATGKHLVAVNTAEGWKHQRRQGLGPDAAVPQDGDAITREKEFSK